MRVSSALAAFVAAGAGLATGVVGYQNSAAIPEVPAQDVSPVVAVGKPLPDAPPRIRTQLADCVPPAELEGGVCVTRVVERVPAPAPEAEVVAQPVAAAPAPAAPPVAVAAPPAPAAPQAHCDDGGSDHEDAEEAAEEREEAKEEAAEEAEDAAEDREDSAEDREDAAEDAQDEREDAAEEAGDHSGSEADC